MGIFQQCADRAGGSWSHFVRAPESAAKIEGSKLNSAGALLTALGLGGIVYAFIESRLFVGLLGLVAMGAFVLVEARSGTPMLPLGLLRSRIFAASCRRGVPLRVSTGGVDRDCTGTG
jgi:hypothetical protein